MRTKAVFLSACNVSFIGIQCYKLNMLRISDASSMFLYFCKLVFLSVTSACAPFSCTGLALRCHVWPSSQTKNLPAMKSTSEGGGERERGRSSGWRSKRRHIRMEQEHMYVWRTLLPRETLLSLSLPHGYTRYYFIICLAICKCLGRPFVPPLSFLLFQKRYNATPTSPCSSWCIFLR